MMLDNFIPQRAFIIQLHFIQYCRKLYQVPNTHELLALPIVINQQPKKRLHIADWETPSPNIHATRKYIQAIVNIQYQNIKGMCF